MEYKDESVNAICQGFDISLANDLHPPGKFRFLRNVRVLTDGVLEGRKNLQIGFNIGSGGFGIPHTIKTLIDESNGNKIYLLGVADKIFVGNGLGPLLLPAVAGVSGNPLSIVEFRPDDAIQPFLYCADTNKLFKIGADGSVSDIGLDAPALPLLAFIDEPNNKIIDECGDATVGDWNNLTGTAGVPTTLFRINTTIQAIVVDNTTPGFISIVPTAFTASIQEGAIISLNGTENSIIESVISAGIASTTIEQIVYDDNIGLTGPCTIVLTSAPPELTFNSILKLNGTEYVRVLNVVAGQDGSVAIETSTVGTFAATNTVEGFASFRCYANLAHVVTDTVITKAIQTVITASGLSSITKVHAFDFMSTAEGPLSLADFFHASMVTNDPSLITEIQIQVDVDSTTNDFAHNYYFYSISPNFLLGAQTQTIPTISALQQAIQRQQLLNQSAFNQFTAGRPLPADTGPEVVFPFVEPTIPAIVGGVGQGPLGMNQWNEILIPLNAFTKVGTDTTRSLKDIKAIRISVNCTAGCTVLLDSLWVGGGTEVDSQSDPQLFPYNYVYSFRDPDTKVFSNWSPALRNAIEVGRTGVVLQVDPTVAALYPNTYVIDFGRFGGTQTTFRYLGTVKNDGSTFLDNVSDIDIADNQVITRDNTIGSPVFDYYKPFPLVDSPKKGTCNVVGTKFQWVTGDKLKTSYVDGTIIKIDGKVNSFYGPPSSDEIVSLVKNVDNLVGVTFEIDSPLMEGQPLPIFFGPFGDGTSSLVFFAAGNPLAAGTLYWTDGNSADTSSNTNNLEITGPAEPIIGGVIHDSYPFVYTRKRSFTILPSFTNGFLQFIARENATNRGLFSKDTICSNGDYIYTVSENGDGIYRTQGSGIPENITTSAFNSMFIHNGVAPTQDIDVGFSQLLSPPDWSSIEDIRLFALDEFIIFRYKIIAGSTQCMIYDTRIENWISNDIYTVDIGCFVKDANSPTIWIGCGEGEIRTYSDGDTSEGANSLFIVNTYASNSGDPRNRKRYAELALDIVEMGTYFAQVSFDNDASFFPFPTVFVGSGTGLRTQRILDINGGVGIDAINMAFSMSWTLTKRNKLYGYTSSFIPLPEERFNKALDFDDVGIIGNKYFLGLTIKADTGGINKTAIIEDSDGNQLGTIILNHVSDETKTYPVLAPFYAHAVRLIFDAEQALIKWSYWQHQWIAVPDVEFAALTTNFDDVGQIGDKFFKGFTLDAITSGIVNLSIYGDNVLKQVIPINHAGRIQKSYAFTTPFIASIMQIIPDTPLHNEKIQYIFDKYPELVAVPTTWDNGGDNGLYPKWYQGFRLFADTNGLDVHLEIQGDSEQVLETIVVNHNLPSAKDYWFQVPHISHIIRAVPNPLEPLRNFMMEWIFDRESPLAEVWETQETTHDLPGFQTVKRVGLSMVSNADVTLTVTIDGVAQIYTYPSTSMANRKNYSYLIPVKGKQFKYRVESSQPFRLYLKNCEILVRSWEQSDGYKIVNPFGEISRENGARI